MSDDFFATKIEFTHYFVFHDQLYGIDLTLFNKHSPYFHNFRNLDTQINLLDENEKTIPISKQAAEIFINYCQYRGFSKALLDDKETVVGLHYLANKYSVNELKNLTADYISNHHQDLAIHSLRMYPNDSRSQIYEQTIADDFYKYIKDPFLSTVPIPNLFRILDKAKVDFDNEDVYNFLFKCLKETRGRASILFSNAKLEKRRSQYLNELTKPEYNFDFHYLNTEYLKGIYELEKVIVSKAEMIKDEQRDSSILAEKRQKQFEAKSDEITAKINELSLMHNELIKNIQEEGEKQMKNIQSRINEMINIKNELIAEANRQFDDMNNGIRTNINDLNQAKASFIFELNNEMNKICDTIDQKGVTWNSNLASIASDLSVKSEKTLNAIKQDTVQTVDSKNKDIQTILARNSRNIETLTSDQDSLKNNFDSLNRIIDDMNRVHFYIDEPGNVEKFNQLRGATQLNVFSKLSNIHPNTVHESIKNLLSYIATNVQSDYEKEFIALTNNTNISNLNDNVGIRIPCDISILLSNKGKLQGNEVIELFTKFKSPLFEINYPMTNFDTIFSQIEKIIPLDPQSHSPSGQIHVYINGINSTTDRFINNKLITSVTFGDDVKTIVQHPGYGRSSFEACSWLKEIHFSNSIREIQGWAFNLCENLTQVNFPESLKSISEGSFAACHSLQQVRIPSTIEVLHDKCFEDCENLATLIFNPKTTTIEPHSFDKCNKLRTLEFDSTTTTIPLLNYSFLSNISTIIIPTSVTYIEQDAFKNCSSLEHIVIPPSVRSLMPKTFDSCTNLTKLTIDVYQTKFDLSTFAKCTRLSHLCFYDGINFLPEFDYKLLPTITTITIPNSVTSIGWRAFAQCRKLEKIIIPNSVVSIDSDAFHSCLNLKSITIPSSVKSLGGGIFFHCDKLTKVTIPPSVTYLGGGAFGDCATLQEVSLPNSIHTIEQNMFRNCKNLTTCNIPPTVTSIEEGAFSGCSSLATLEIPKFVSYLGAGAFYGCVKLSRISISETITEIKKHTFYQCQALKTIELPNGITAIHDDAFGRCSKLESVTMGNKVLSIGLGSFAYCEALTKMIIPQSVKSIGCDAFYGSRNIKQIKLPKNCNRSSYYGITSPTTVSYH